MESYGTTLKQLTKFTNVKLTTLADAAGYDVSYISKWCNKSNLPATRTSSSINNKFAKIFSDEIISQGIFENFCSKYNAKISVDELENYINEILKTSFKTTLDYNERISIQKTDHKTKILINQTDILNFWDSDFADYIFNSLEPVEILCTMDIVPISFAHHQIIENSGRAPKSHVHARVGLNIDNLSTKDLLQLYYFINKFHHISFDFFNNQTFNERNLIVIKDKAAIMCSLDYRGKSEMLSVITEPEKIDVIYNRTSSLFKISHLLIMSMLPNEMLTSGYRSNFYAFSEYQIFLAKGFEYLVPPELIDNIVLAAYEQGYDKCTEKMLRKLAVTWEDLFHNENLDFYMLKSDLVKYIEDGEFYFTDIVYRMSADERKKHIQRVLDLTQQNPNINFYIIDDENISYPSKYTTFSLYSNHNKLFLKNTRSFSDSCGPQFYGILSEPLIAKIGDVVSLLKDKDACSHFSAPSLKEFMKQYGVMVERIISLSEINNPY